MNTIIESGMTNRFRWYHWLIALVLGLINPTYAIRYMILHSDNVRWDNGIYHPPTTVWTFGDEPGKGKTDEGG